MPRDVLDLVLQFCLFPTEGFTLGLELLQLPFACFIELKRIGFVSESGLRRWAFTNTANLRPPVGLFLLHVAELQRQVFVVGLDFMALLENVVDGLQDVNFCGVRM